jgi:hypothetical protein
MTPRQLVLCATVPIALAAFAPAPRLVTPSLPMWDATGHMVVARVAWDHMTPLTRARAVALLRRAPGDARVCALGPTGSASAAQLRNCFVTAATWPDRIRSTPRDHPSWHFVNTFWQVGSDGAPVDLSVPRSPENAVSRLAQVKDSVADVQVADTTRAMQLAWIEHLVGDIHQPLHTSSQVTALNPLPQADRGGNRFALAGQPDNLHSWWDGSLRRQFPRRASELNGDGPYITRVSNRLQAANPAAVPVPDPFAFEAWLQEGMHTVRGEVYGGVQPNTHPDAAYGAKTTRIADPSAVRGGIRLAALLNRLFDPLHHG